MEQQRIGIDGAHRRMSDGKHVHPDPRPGRVIMARIALKTQKTRGTGAHHRRAGKNREEKRRERKKETRRDQKLIRRKYLKKTHKIRHAKKYGV